MRIQDNLNFIHLNVFKKIFGSSPVFAKASPSTRSLRITEDDGECKLSLTSSRAQRGDPVLHIDLRKWADIAIIAPLDANTLAKVITLIDRLPVRL